MEGRSPEDVLRKMEELVAAASEDRETRPLDGVPPVARKHRERIRDGAE